MINEVNKIWGRELWIVNNDYYCAKFLEVLPLHICSDHRHLLKTETFHVLDGIGAITVNKTVQVVHKGDTIHIPVGTYHCFTTEKGMTLLEVSSRHEDSDVERRGPSHRLSLMEIKELRKILKANNG
jgi:mannose-6-phosphate isomerase-like protein (cupin superfamily)